LRRFRDHVRSQLVGYVALFIALGGTSYATIELSNHSITPVKLNPRSIGGYVRAWASVNANGRVAESAGGVRVVVDSGVGPGHYVIDWHPRPSSPCEATGSVDLSNGLVPGYVIAQTAGRRVRGEQSIVQTYNAQGQPDALAFDVQLICATPR
jgi:hypothetical protein